MTMHMRLWFTLTLLSACHGFTAGRRVAVTKQLPRTVHFNFLKGLFDAAFENDRSLSSVDTRKGMLEGPNSIDSSSSMSSPPPLTDVQRAWRERQSTAGATLTRELLQNAVLSVDLYLSGVPSRDPSNDLYGSRVNISSRNKELGLDIPQEPNAAVELTFLPEGVCRCAESPFTAGRVDGEWKLSDDGTQLRFSMDVLGYSRTIQTKGSIERIFWSDEPELTLQTSSQYSIPPGWVYGDVKIGSGTRPGTIDFKSSGVLRVEQTMGLLGAASKLVACGTFDIKVKQDGRQRQEQQQSTGKVTGGEL